MTPPQEPTNAELADWLRDRSVFELEAGNDEEWRVFFLAAERLREMGDFNAGVEAAAKIFDEIAVGHGSMARWMGPERQYYTGVRIPGLEMRPMNGPAISHDAALKTPSTSVRSSATTHPRRASHDKDAPEAMAKSSVAIRQRCSYCVGSDLPDASRSAAPWAEGLRPRQS